MRQPKAITITWIQCLKLQATSPTHQSVTRIIKNPIQIFYCLIQSSASKLKPCLKEVYQVKNNTRQEQIVVRLNTIFLPSPDPAENVAEKGNY